jgi:hypothetical protein
LLPAALITGVLGFVGVLAARGLRELSAFAVIGSMGVLLVAVPAPVASVRMISTNTLPLVLVVELNDTLKPTSFARRVAGVDTAATVFAVVAVSEMLLALEIL